MTVRTWLAGVSTISMLIGAPVLAQTAQQAPANASNGTPDPTSEAVQNAPQPANELTARRETTDIVVTARRRSELLQNVPIAVSAITADIAVKSGISGLEAITLSTPNLQFNREISQGATPFLRGVGSPQASAGGESPVAVYVDDVYISSPNGNMFGFNNISSVQVLKGPQGTLFGRNATGGVIQVQTKRPTQEPSAEATMGYGNYNTITGSFYGTTGVTNDLAVNIAAAGTKQSDGYGRSLITNKKTLLGWDWSVRAQALWTPSATTKLLLIGDYSKQRTDVGSNSTVYPGSISVTGSTYQGFNTQSLGTDYATVNQGGVSLRIDQETSFADLVSITAYRETRFTFFLDQDASPVRLVAVGPVKSPTDTFSQEFQIVSKPESTIKWIGGLYLLDSRTGYDPNTVAGAFIAPLQRIETVDRQKLRSYAAFGEVTVPLFSDATHLTGGLRYTRDVYDLNVKGRTANGTIPLPGNTFQKHDVFPKVTYRVILDHRWAPDIMTYASYSRGFRSGGYQLAFPGNAANPAPVVQPEILDAYEVGFKTQFFNHKLTFNGAAFYYDDKNVAISFVQPGGNLILNAAGAHIKGLDLDFIALPARGLRISGGVGYLDTEYNKFPNGPILLPNPATCTPGPALLPGPRTGGNIACTGDLSGNRTIRAPKFTLTLAPSYTVDTNAGSFTLAANFYHNSGFFWDVSNRLKQSAYDVVNATLTWDSPSKNFNIRVWVKNLGDKHYGVYSAPNVLLDVYGQAAPRTYGVTAGVKL